MTSRLAVLVLSFFAVLAASAWASGPGHDGDRSSRLTPPEGAPFQDARGEVELGREALVVEAEGLPEGEYAVCLDDGSGTLAPIGSIVVTAHDGDDDDDDGDEEGDGSGAHEGDDDDDGDEGPDTEGSLRLSGDSLPFGATSPLELAGRAISIKAADSMVVLQGMTPSPIVEDPDEREGRCPLTRPEPPVDADAEGVLKLESGDGRIVIKVRVSNLEPATIYDIVFTNPADSMSEVIGMITTDDEGDGKFKIDTEKGDSVPFGAADLAALEGFGVAVRAPDGSVVLTGTVCEAKVDDDDGHDGDGDDDDDDGHDGDDDDDDEGEDDECEVDLARAETSPDPDAEGEAEIEGDELEVEVKRLAEGTYEVFLIDPAEGGAAESIGTLTPGEDGDGELELEAGEGVTLPFGKTSVAEFVNFIVEVRAADGAVVLRGTLPAVACEEEDDEHDGDDGDDGDEHEGEGLPDGSHGLLAPVAETLFVLEGEFDAPFLRGDANRDGTLDITDPLNALQFLFSGGSRPYCLDASDANDDGEVNISDAIALLGYLFLGSGRPGAPGTMIPGSDPTADKLYCEETAITPP